MLKADRQTVHSLGNNCRKKVLKNFAITLRWLNYGDTTACAEVRLNFRCGIQLFRETFSEKSTKLHKPIAISKGSMGRRIELLHVLNTNEI